MKKFIIGLWVWCGVLTGLMGGMGRVFAVDDYNNGDEPGLYIRAVNPGYTVSGVGNVGEMIEIGWRGSDDKVSLAGATVGYTNSSGNYSTIVEFPENSWITGESILLRLASSPKSELANLTYSKTLAMKGGVDIRRGDEVIDSVCWSGKDGCYREFKSAAPTTLVRNNESGVFEHWDEYEPQYDPGNYYVEILEDENGFGEVAGHCAGLMFSEILSYYETTRAEQFIEIYNSAAEQILLDGCKIRYRNKEYGLTGILPTEGYLAYYPTEFGLTKNPTNGNTIELIDENGAALDKLFYPNGQRKGTAYAMIGYDEKGEELWKITYSPTPGVANNYQEFKTCEAGKVINEATGNCVKSTAVSEKICAEGQYLNILTGRCKKYATNTERTCKEGYYLNLETGRCRKIVENMGANYGLTPEKYEEKSAFVGLYVTLGVVGVGLLYLGYEFRHDIGKLLRRVVRRK